MKTRRARVAVGLSGGVDSSVAAVLLREKGFDVRGVAMSIYDGPAAASPGASNSCYSPGESANIESAARICRQIGIPFEVIDLKKAFRKCVLDYVRNEYLAGRTPNPCIACNRQVKFGFLLDKIQKAGLAFDHFATGHYARIARVNNRLVLQKPADHAKDQTYFLYGLTQTQLAQTLFPLGDHLKTHVRELARSFGLQTAERPESQDFFNGGGYAALFDAAEQRPGDIVDSRGTVLGRHRGIVHYTIGQRRGLGIAHSKPLYVLAIDVAANRLVVGGQERLFASGLIAGQFNLNWKEKLDRPYEVMAKIRFRSPPAKAAVFPYRKNAVKVVFDNPQKAVTPGQSVVLYLDDFVFGGGVIDEVIHNI